MPDINFRLTATDEASPVIDRLRQKLGNANSSGTSSYGTVRGSGGSSGNAGTGGFLGSGKIAAGAGITIIAQAALQALQKIYAQLLQASPYLRAVSDQFKTAMNIYFRPLGDSLAKALQPKSEWALEKADERAAQIEALDEQFGVVGAALGTFGFLLYDAKMALWEFNYGVWDTLSKVYLWPIDKLGELLGVDLPGSLTELLEQMFGIKGGFAGIQDFFEKGLPEKLGQMGENFKTNFMAGLNQIVSFFSGIGESLGSTFSTALTAVGTAVSGFGTWLWEQITKFVGDPLGTLANLGSWLWGQITSALSGAWSTISGFGTWIYNSLKNALGGIGYEAYKAFHNAIASMLNSIANIELPLVGKPFKGLFGTIPMLASGGIVTKPTLAMIGERGAEAVIPLNRGGLGMNQGITVQINAPVYGVGDLESAIDNAIRRSQMGYASYR